MENQDQFKFTRQYDDPSAKIWTAYVSEAEKHDRTLVRGWKGDMDSILIFAGLFSASVTAFIIESYRDLSPNPDDITIALLSRIAQRLEDVSFPFPNTTTPISAQPLNQFIPATSTVVCNALWFLSLAFSLACALSATLVEQWARNYLQATESRSTPHKRARIGTYLFKGVERFQMTAVVETIPMLLHISLLLFFIGLVEFLRPINTIITYILVAVLITCAALYILITVLPIAHLDCPYRSPLSGVWWWTLRAFRLLHYRDHLGIRRPITTSMAKTREMLATQISPQRDARDLKAMCWMLRSLREHTELEPFVEVIPDVVAGYDYSAKHLLHRLLNHPDNAVRLGYRIPRLLSTCTDGALGRRRAVTCLSAIWSLSMMSVPSESPLEPASPRFNSSFLSMLKTIRQEIPSVAGYTTSAIAVVVRGLLDLYVDRTLQQYEETQAYLRSSNRTNIRQQSQDCVGPPLHNKRLHETQALAQRLGGTIDPTVSGLYPVIDAVSTSLDTLVLELPNDQKSSLQAAQNTLRIIHQFQTSLNEAGFYLMTEYMRSLLTEPSLPFEAVNTARRLFFKIDFELTVTTDQQSLFVTYLDDILELDSTGNTKVPKSIVNVLLALTRSIRQHSCVLKARKSIIRYLQSSPGDEPAQKALSALDLALSGSAPPSEILSIFEGHLYSQSKVEKSSFTRRRHPTMQHTNPTDEAIRFFKSRPET